MRAAWIAALAAAGCNQVFGLDPLARDGGIDAEIDAMPPRRVTHIAAGGNHTCARTDDNRVWCWGSNAVGQLGLGSTIAMVTTPTSPAMLGDAPITGLTTGTGHTCVVDQPGQVMCWGNGNDGQLGYGDTMNVGTDGPPSSAGFIDLGAAVSEVRGGGRHTCARLTDGRVRCWGAAEVGQLGANNTDPVGDSDPPRLGVDVVDVAARTLGVGNDHACAITTNGNVACWGAGSDGRLGYGATANLGDDMSDPTGAELNFTMTMSQVVAGGAHSCAVSSDERVACWGDNGALQLGVSGDVPAVGDLTTVGDNQLMLANVVEVAAGSFHTCVRLRDGEVRCWGRNNYGQLGIGNTTSQTATSTGRVPLPRPATAIEAGINHTCAILDDGTVACWGQGQYGKLGYGSEANVGTTTGTLPSFRI